MAMCDVYCSLHASELFRRTATLISDNLEKFGTPLILLPLYWRGYPTELASNPGDVRMPLDREAFGLTLT